MAKIDDISDSIIAQLADKPLGAFIDISVSGPATNMVVCNYAARKLKQLKGIESSVRPVPGSNAVRITTRAPSEVTRTRKTALRMMIEALKVGDSIQIQRSKHTEEQVRRTVERVRQASPTAARFSVTSDGDTLRVSRLAEEDAPTSLYAARRPKSELRLAIEALQPGESLDAGDTEYTTERRIRATCATITRADNNPGERRLEVFVDRVNDQTMVTRLHPDGSGSLRAKRRIEQGKGRLVETGAGRAKAAYRVAMEALQPGQSITLDLAEAKVTHHGIRAAASRISANILTFGRRFTIANNPGGTSVTVARIDGLRPSETLYLGRRGGGRKPSWPFTTMEVGEAQVVEGDYASAQALVNYQRRKHGKAFKISKQPDESILILRTA